MAVTSYFRRHGRIENTAVAPVVRTVFADSQVEGRHRFAPAVEGCGFPPAPGKSRKNGEPALPGVIERVIHLPEAGSNRDSQMESYSGALSTPVRVGP